MPSTHPLQALAAELGELQRAIESLPPEGVASCLEYVMLPLLYLADSAAHTRSSQGDMAELLQVLHCDMRTAQSEIMIGCLANVAMKQC